LQNPKNCKANIAFQQFSVCDYQLLSEKENSSHEAAKPQRHKEESISQSRKE
jgi:hypothetical protein